jgi:hypothetical protein
VPLRLVCRLGDALKFGGTARHAQFGICIPVCASKDFVEFAEYSVNLY